MNKIGFVFLVSILSLSLLNCGGKKEEQLSAEQLDSLRATYYALNDSLENAWQQMVEDDEKKLAYLRRLVEEVANTNNYSEEEYQTYMNMIDGLANMRYTQETMINSEVIDEYDSASSEVISRITQYAYNHPNFENYPLMQELIDDLNQAQSMLLIYRSRYDMIAKNLNDFIEENQHRLIDKDNTKVQYKKKPLFEYPNEEGDPYELGDTLNM
jgi:hypothetical protein